MKSLLGWALSTVMIVICSAVIVNTVQKPAVADERILVPSLRIEFIELNQTMAELCAREQLYCEMVNVGEVENDGTGDPIWFALAKIDANLRAIEWRAQERQAAGK